MSRYGNICMLSSRIQKDVWKGKEITTASRGWKEGQDKCVVQGWFVANRENEQQVQ